VGRALRACTQDPHPEPGAQCSTPSPGAQASPPAASPARASGRATTSWARHACAARSLHAPHVNSPDGICRPAEVAGPVRSLLRPLPGPCAGPPGARRRAPERQPPHASAWQLPEAFLISRCSAASSTLPRDAHHRCSLSLELSSFSWERRRNYYAAVFRVHGLVYLRCRAAPAKMQHWRRAQEELRARQAALGPRDALTVQARPRRCGALDESAQPVTLRFRCARARALRSECARARHGGAVCWRRRRRRLLRPCQLCCLSRFSYTEVQACTSARPQGASVPARWLCPPRRCHKRAGRAGRRRRARWTPSPRTSICPPAWAWGPPKRLIGPPSTLPPSSTLPSRSTRARRPACPVRPVLSSPLASRRSAGLVRPPWWEACEVPTTAWCDARPSALACLLCPVRSLLFRECPPVRGRHAQRLGWPGAA
jgi:hypothetical protein